MLMEGGRKSREVYVLRTYLYIYVCVFYYIFSYFQSGELNRAHIDRVLWFWLHFEHIL